MVYFSYSYHAKTALGVSIAALSIPVHKLFIKFNILEDIILSSL